MKSIPKNFLPAVIVATLAAAMGFIIAPIESLYIQHLNPNGFVIGAVYAFGSLLLILLSLWFGQLADRGYRHRLIFIGLIFAVIYPFLYANVLSALEYAGVKVFWAIAGVATGPLILGHIQDSLAQTKQKGMWFGYYYAAASIVGAAGHFLGGYLAQNFDLSAPYIAIGILAIINLTIAAVFFKPIEKAVSKETIGGGLSGFSYFFKHPPLLFYIIMNIAVDLNFGVKYILWPLIIFGLVHDSTIIGSVFATMGVVAFIVLGSSRAWADTYNPYKVLFLSLGLLTLAGFTVSTTSDITIFWIAAATFAIGESMAGPPQAILLTQNIPSALRGRLLAADDTIDKIIASLSPLLAGSLLVILSPQQVFVLYAVIALAGILLGSIVYRRYQLQISS